MKPSGGGGVIVCTRHNCVVSVSNRIAIFVCVGGLEARVEIVPILGNVMSKCGGAGIR